MQHSRTVQSWHPGNLVVLEAPDEDGLRDLREDACLARIPNSSFYEPDYGDALTAIALAPSLKSQALCANLPLMLREAALV